MVEDRVQEGERNGAGVRVKAWQGCCGIIMAIFRRKKISIKIDLFKTCLDKVRRTAA